MANYDSRFQEILRRLAKEYPNRAPLLHYDSPFELVVSVSLSAQTTDAAVNKSTPELFQKWPTPRALANADVGELEEVIHSLGFFRQKARNLISAARLLEDKYAGEVPESMDHLTSLPGVGRKSANVIRAHIWNRPGIIVDTHFGRVTRRLGLTKESNPEKLERDFLTVVPLERQIEFSMTANLHGRKYCTARTPNCTDCFLADICPKLKG